MSKLTEAQYNELVLEARLRIPQEISRLQQENDERRRQIARLEKAILRAKQEGLKK